MIHNTYSHYCILEEKLENDEELKHLKQQLQKTSEQVSLLKEQLTEQQQDILTEYLGICAEIDQRIVEIACFCDK